MKTNKTKYNTSLDMSIDKLPGAPFNRNIEETIECARKLLFLADKGDMQRGDDGCGVLYGIVRDSAYRIKKLAEAEKEKHRLRGIWDLD